MKLSCPQLPFLSLLFCTIVIFLNSPGTHLHAVILSYTVFSLSLIATPIRAILSHIHNPKLSWHPTACSIPKISCPLAISRRKLYCPQLPLLSGLSCHIFIFLSCPVTHLSTYMLSSYKISCPLAISHMDYPVKQ
jgi:hypothetical protein